MGFGRKIVTFNYCGDVIEQVIVSAGDAGTPVIGETTLVDVCGL